MPVRWRPNLGARGEVLRFSETAAKFRRLQRVGERQGDVHDEGWGMNEIHWSGESSWLNAGGWVFYGKKVCDEAHSGGNRNAVGRAMPDSIR